MKIADVLNDQKNAPQTPMPSYISHQKVWALKIKKVHVDEDGQGIVLIFDGHFGPHAITSSQLEHKPIPEDGMYFVQYEGGYFSFSPADAFEKGYSAVDDELVVEKITLRMGKTILTPSGELKSVTISQENRWGVLGELHLTDRQAIVLAEQINKKLGY